MSTSASLSHSATAFAPTPLHVGPARRYSAPLGHRPYHPARARLLLHDARLLEPTGAAGQDNPSDAGMDAPEADVPHEASEEAGDASEEASPDAPQDAGCTHALPPDPPGVNDAGGDISFIVAGLSIDFGDLPGSDPQEIGYDLDMRCTCPESNGCLRESWATYDACDGPGGRDNMTGKFL
ncbi:MAG: hypothetical protein ACOC1F_14730 [Myxococcota bacterium]